MKIIVLMPKASGKYEDDTMQHCKALEKYGGHTIIRAYVPSIGRVAIDESQKEDAESADIIWCPYEDMLLSAMVLKNNFKIPLVGHFEIALVGRFLQDVTDVHWCSSEEPPTDDIYNIRFYNSYRNFLKLYLQCDIKTITGQFHKFRCEKLIGLPLGKTYIKPYPMDSESYDKYIKENVEEKYQVCSVYRLVIYKKTKHIIKALSLLSNPPKYVVGGTGYCEDELKEYAKELGVDVEFRGHISDEEKVKLLQESMFSFSHYGWIPPTEAAYLKKPCVCYYEPDTYERLKDIPYYTEANNIKKLAEVIKELSEDEDKRKEIGLSAYNKLINNECHTHLLKEDSRLLTEIFEEALR